MNSITDWFKILFNIFKIYENSTPKIWQVFKMNEIVMLGYLKKVPRQSLKDTQENGTQPNNTQHCETSSRTYFIV
jgi:hypothetical protein